MFYAKNVPAWERIARIIAGLAALAFAATQWGTSAVAVAAGIAGAGLAVSGLVGFCPMCAMVGRKLDKRR